MNELKLCPFCGGEGKVIKLNQKGFKGEYKVFIRCTKCGLKTNTQYPLPHDSYLTRLERAINSWNSNLNPIADHLQQENERLKELLQLAVGDMKNNCKTCVNRTKWSDSEECKDCQCNEHARGYLWKWQWQHANQRKGLIEND